MVTAFGEWTSTYGTGAFPNVLTAAVANAMTLDTVADWWMHVSEANWALIIHQICFVRRFGTPEKRKYESTNRCIQEI